MEVFPRPSFPGDGQSQRTDCSSNSQRYAKTQRVEQKNAIYSCSSDWASLGINTWHLSYYTACKKEPTWKDLGSLMSQPSIMLLIELDHLSASQYFL